MKKLIKIALILLTISHSALAQMSSELERTIYSMVLKHCSSPDVNLKHSLAFVESMKNSFRDFNEVSSFNIDPALQLYKDHGLSPTTSIILNSMALHQALTTCYGDHESLKNHFVINMIATDLLGRTVGTIQGITAFVIGGKFFAYILKKAHQALMISSYGKNLNPANKTLHMGVMGSGVGLALITPHFFELIKIKKASQTKDSADLTEYRGILEIAHAELKRIYQSQGTFCEKSNAAFEVALIIQDTYQILKQRDDGKQLSDQFESVYNYTLNIKPCKR